MKWQAQIQQVEEDDSTGVALINCRSGRSTNVQSGVYIIYTYIQLNIESESGKSAMLDKHKVTRVLQERCAVDTIDEGHFSLYTRPQNATTLVYIEKKTMETRNSCADHTLFVSLSFDLLRVLNCRIRAHRKPILGRKILNKRWKTATLCLLFIIQFS